MQNFIIRKWSCWPSLSNESNESDILNSVPKMLRRRLSPLAKTVICACKTCAGDRLSMPVIFSSTHGELAKSFKMMEMIEAGEEISPTAFSLSVHNAIAGLFSIAFKNNKQSMVLAPGEDGIAAAFIEALGLLQEGEEEVLIVFYDEPLVEFYPSSPYKLSTDQRNATALIITKSGEGQSIKFSRNKQTGYDGEQALQIPLLKQFLAGNEQSLIIQTGRGSWCWEKQ